MVLVFENSYNHRLFSTYTQKNTKINNKQHGESKFEAAALKALSIRKLRARQHPGILNSK